MSCWTWTVPLRGASLGLCLAGVALVGISCRSDDVAGPTPLGTTNPVTDLASTAGELRFRQISASVGGATCGVTAAHRAYCWGYGGGGQLGQGTFTSSLRPVAVSGGKKFREVATGFSHTCGIAMDRRAYCWGAGELLGTGDDVAHATPVPVAGGLRFIKIDVAVFHSCGVTTTNRVYCWGYNFHGMVGDGTSLPRPTPVRVAGGRRYITVSTGNGHTCAITTAHRAFCWGSNNFGKLGNGSAVDRSLVPVPVAGMHSFGRLSSSWDHTCGVTLSHRALCWGHGLNGEIGDGTLLVRRTPRAVSGGLRIASVQAGVVHSCALTTRGRAYCWGHNDSGQLGNGSANANDDALVPGAVSGGLTFKALSAGSGTCGATAAGRAYCWGDGTALVPTAVPSPM